MPVLGSYNGIDLAACGATWEFTLGPTPNVGTITLVGHYETVTAGDLVLYDGDYGVTITGLVPVSWRKADGPDGQVTIVEIRDSRWRWAARGHITGEWNKPGPDGAENAQKTVRQLVALCLDALEETSYDVTALPTDLYPYVSWEFAKPGEEINRLCDLCGCALGLTAAGRAKVYKLGTGAAIPAGWKTRNDLGTQLTQKPDKYTVRGARAIIQRELELVPVALDVDGTVKEFEDLSYYADAAGHWGSFGGAAAQLFGDWLFGTDAGDRAAAEAANKSVYRYYRLGADYLWMAPILSEICETTTENGKVVRKKPYLTVEEAGFYDRERHEMIDCDTGVVSDGFEIDAERGLVILRDSLMVENGDSWDPATITLTFAFESRQEDGTLEDADYYSFSGGSGLNETVLPVEWLVLRGIWDPVAEPPAVVWENQDALDAIAAKIIAAAEETETSYTLAQILYPGIIFIFPDGAIRQVAWHVGADGATTTIVRNTELPALGGQRLELRVAALRRRYEAAQGKSAHERGSLAGHTRPEKAGSGGGVSAGPRDEWVAERRPIYNNGATDCPACGLLELSGGLHATRKIQQGIRPDGNDLDEFVIANGVIPAGFAGRGWISGEHDVLVSDYANVAVGDPVGLQSGSHYARKTYLGPLIVIGKRGNDTVRVRWGYKHSDWVRTAVPSGGYVTVKALDSSGAVIGPAETVRAP